MSGIFVESPTIARSNVVFAHNLAGEPSKVEWRFGDAVVGLDNTIEGELHVFDIFGNPYRAEGMRVLVEWEEGLLVDGSDEGIANQAQDN